MVFGFDPSTFTGSLNLFLDKCYVRKKRKENLPFFQFLKVNPIVFILIHTVEQSGHLIWQDVHECVPIKGCLPGLRNQGACIHLKNAWTSLGEISSHQSLYPSFQIVLGSKEKWSELYGNKKMTYHKNGLEPLFPNILLAEILETSDFMFSPIVLKF